MRGWWLVAAVACSGAVEPTDGAPTDSEATDALTDAGTTDADTGEAPDEARLRALHVGATLPGQDMFGNGNAGQPPLVDLLFGEAWPSARPWATRPADEVTFTFVDDGAPKPWIEFGYTLEAGASHTLLVYGTADDRGVVRVRDAVEDVPKDRVRIRWTHAAPSLAGMSVVFEDAEGRDAYNGGTAVAYGDSVVFDEGVDEVNLWVDLDGSTTCDDGEAFEPFERPAGDYFHVVLTEDAEGVLLLQGLTLAGQAATRPLADGCP